MKITLSYQPQQLAPPFAYAAVMNIETEESGIAIEFMIEYLGREEISNEELRVEGFTKNDDLSWKGDIDARWKSDIESLAQLNFKDDPHNEIYLHLEVDGQKLGFPKEVEKAELFFQELMQAVLEKGEIEAPLVVTCQFEKESYELKWEFAKRLIHINGNESINWELGRQFLKDIYAIDFEALKSSQKPVSNSINLGYDLWYVIKNKHVITTFQKQINELIR